jgi:hypothetical protein
MTGSSSTAVAPAPPDGPGGLTADWFAAALRAGGRDVAVATVRQTPLDGGYGFMSSIVKCELEYTGTSRGPVSLIAKLLRPHRQSLKHAQVVGLWEREMRFYADLGKIVNLPVPQCYFSAADPTRNTYVILLEDVSGLDQPRVASIAQTELVIRSLAGLHAQFWGGDHPALMVLETEQELQRRLRILIREAWPAFEATFAGKLSAHALDVVRTSIDLFGEELTGCGLPPTLLHYDYRPANMLFGGPRGHVVLDWQSAVVGQAPYDLAHFLHQGLTPDDLRAHETDFIRLYFDQLKSCGVDPGPFDRFLAQYRRGQLGRIPMSVLSVAYDRSGLPEELRALPTPDYDDLLPIWDEYIASSR